MQEKEAKIKGLLGLFRKAVPEVKTGFFGGLAKETKETYKRLAGISPVPTGAEKLQSQYEAIRMALPILGIAGAAAGTAAISEKVKDRLKTDKAFSTIMEDPDISSAEAGRAEALFETLKTYAPSVAKDPLIAQSFVKGMLQYGHVDHKVVTDLMTAERIHRELKAQPFTALQAIKNVSWIA